MLRNKTKDKRRTQDAGRRVGRSSPLTLDDKSLGVPNVSLSLNTYPHAGHGPLSAGKQIPIQENSQTPSYVWRKFLMPTVHRFAQPIFGGSRVRCGMRRVGVLSASGPVSSCQLAGSPAFHGQLCVSRVFHCQAQLVSSAQRPSVGYSRCSCPATAAFGLSQLCLSAAPPSSPSAIRSRCSLPALEV